MKLAKGSKLRITNFELKPIGNFKHPHLVQNCLCEMILSGKHFMSVTKILIEDNFSSVLPVWKKCGRFVISTKKKSTGVEDISSEVPKYLDIHHVCLKTF
jgi:hypothetical protein